MALVSKPLSIANVENGKSPFTHYAWAWNQLGTDRFTLEYPNENTFWSGTQFQTLTGGVLPTRDQTLAPNGFRFTGVNGGTGSFRVRNVITSNGEWTVSFKVRGSQSAAGSFVVDVCDKGDTQVRIPADNSWVDVSITVNVTNWTEATMHFIDFSSISWLNFFVSDFKVEKSAKKTPWVPSPKDDPTNASPLYQGVYTDNTTTASTNPQKYTWQRIKGENGANGQDAPTVTAVQVEYTQSLDGVTPPTSGWTSTKPTPNMGYWQWQRVRDVFSNGTYGAWVATSVYYGRDAIIISATEPTPKVDNMLWQKPNDPTVLRWNGSAWVEWGISVDNLVVDNATIENGVFKRIEGVEVIGSTIRNPYTREYLGGVRRDGEITLSEAEFKNAGKMYIDDVLKETYEQIISDRYIRMVRYRGDNFGDENNLIGSATLTFDTLTLVSKGEGVLDHGGSLTARQLTNTQWINLTYATGFRTSENNPCQYRLIYDLQDNPVVQFRGQVERTTGLMTGTTYPFTTLPPAIRTTKNVFKACTGDATELQTIRVGALKGDMGSVSNMIQVKAVGATQYVDISGLSYIVE